MNNRINSAVKIPESILRQAVELSFRNDNTMALSLLLDVRNEKLDTSEQNLEFIKQAGARIPTGEAGTAWQDPAGGDTEHLRLATLAGIAYGPVNVFFWEGSDFRRMSLEQFIEKLLA